jgi:hypothetical protein
MTFIGYANDTKAYQFMSIDNAIFIGVQAMFDELKFPRNKNGNDLGQNDRLFDNPPDQIEIDNNFDNNNDDNIELPFPQDSTEIIPTKSQNLQRFPRQQERLPDDPPRTPEWQQHPAVEEDSSDEEEIDRELKIESSEEEFVDADDNAPQTPSVTE